jgi:two-component system, OmpR family, sensor kinase
MTHADNPVAEIAALRHELCSPLAAVSALLGVLAADDSDPTPTGVRRREIARLAYWQTRHATAVLTGTAGRSRSLTEVVVAAGIAANVPRPRLRTDLTPAAADTAVDAHAVQQVLTNLLGNAVRHGAPDGEIRLAARLERDALLLAVRNRFTGPLRRRPQGQGLRIVDDILRGVDGSFTMRLVSGWVLAEASLPLARV